MNETTQTKQVEVLSLNEERMYLLTKRYLDHVMKELPIIEFYESQFFTLMNAFFKHGKVEAIKYLRSLFLEPSKEWNTTRQNNNGFEEFIKTDCSHIKPYYYRNSGLGLKEAKEIVDWIEANRQYTQY